MRKSLLATVAAAAMVSPAFAVEPAPAPGLYYGGPPGYNSPFYSGIVGGIELSLHRVWDGDEKNLFNGSARANLPIGNSWNVLVETGGSAFFEGGNSISSIGAATHLWRNSGALRYGFYGAVNFTDYTTFGQIGAEAEFDVAPKVTLGAQLSYSFSDDFDVVGVRGWWDYYFTANTKFTGQLAYFSEDNYDAWALSKRVTHRFDGSPINVFAQLDYVSSDGDHAWGLGGGLSFLLDGSGTQRFYDEHVPFDALSGPQFVGFALSDRRLKADIVKVGMLTPDIPLYRFRYIWGQEVFVGVMAQDLLAVRPDAVILNNSGYYSVNYAALGTRMMRLEEWLAQGQARGRDAFEGLSVAAAAS